MKDIFNERIRLIRDAEGLGRKAMADLIGTTRTRLENVEHGLQKTPSDILEGISKAFPQYAYWLISGSELPEAGQISPETDKKRQDLRTA